MFFGKKLYRLISFFLSFVLLFQTFAPAVLAVDELTTPKPAPTEQVTPAPELTPEATPSPTETITPTEEPTPAPTEELTPTPTEELTPAPEATPTAEPTVEPSVTPEITPEPTPTENQATPQQDQSQPSSTPEVTPTPTSEVTPTPTIFEPAATTIVEPAVAVTTDSSFGSLFTDKLDYSPTDTVNITGTNLPPFQTLSITISSTDDPAISFSDFVFTDGDGSFTYAYTLDGNYRPDYSVELRDSTGNVVATTSFTDGWWDWDNDNKPNLTATKTNDANGDVSLGNSFKWKIKVKNTGNANAVFNNNEKILEDDLPVGPNYSLLSTTVSGMSSSNLSCSISGNNLVCVVSGNSSSHVTIKPNDYFEVTFSVTPSQKGNLTNPRQGNDFICEVDPDNNIDETTGNDNDCSDSVNVTGGSIKIIKEVDPGTSTDDFGFQTTGSGLSNFTLEDDGNESQYDDYQKTKLFSNLNSETYTVTENSYAGWTLTNISCNTQETINLSQRKVTINLSTTENVICTFTNTKQSQNGTLIVKKVLPNNNGGTATANQFSFSVNGGTATSFEADGQNDLTVPSGTYSVVETNPLSGYSLSYSNCSNVTVPAGDSATCTITNDDQAATLTVVKNVLNPDGGAIDDNHSFSVTVGAQTDSSFGEGDNAGFTLNSGTYNVTEGTDANYDFISVSEDYDANTSGYQVHLNPGQQKTITITNKQKKATITVIKDVVKSNLSPIEDNHTFQVTVDGNQKPFGEEADAVFEVNPGGSYGATEASDANYVLVSQDGSVTVGSNGNATINIVNRQNTASISGYKYLTGTETGLSLWTINLFEGDAQIGTDTTDENGFYSFNDLFPGNYSLEEILNPGWEQTGSPDPIELNGENIIGQNFYNRGALSITACKYEDSNGPLEGGEYAKVDNWNFSLGDINQSTEEGNCATFENLTPGEYTVTEGSQEGWYSADEQTSQEVELGAEDVTVNFYNYQRGSIFGYKWSDANGNREYDCNSQEDSDEEGTCEEKLPGWTIFIDENGNGELDNGEEEEIAEVSTTTGVGGSYSFEGLEPGTYSICEVQQRGWDQTYPNGEGGQCHQVTVTSGQDSEANFGNHYTPPQLHLDKSNNSTSDETPGSSVTYTITLNVSDNFVDNAIVRDLLPKGFKYRLGSWQAKLNGFTYSITEPEYHSPGDWQLGNLLAGDIVELTYIADIDPTQTPGLYKDIAWAKGDEPVGGGTVLAIADDTTNFVGTQVNVIKDTQDTPTREVEQKVEGQVLGASTTLPATGADTRWLYLALILGLLGTTATSAGIILKRKHE